MVTPWTTPRVIVEVVPGEIVVDTLWFSGLNIAPPSKSVPVTLTQLVASVTDSFKLTELVAPVKVAVKLLPFPDTVKFVFELPEDSLEVASLVELEEVVVCLFTTL